MTSKREMKIGQRVLVVELGYPRDSLSSDRWMFYGELAERIKITYGKVTEAINFSTSPFKQNIKSGQLELYFNGIVLVKILHCPPINKTEYGVGVFWTVGGFGVTGLNTGLFVYYPIKREKDI